MEDVKNMKSVKTPESEHLITVNPIEIIWMQIKQICFILKLLDHYLYEIF